jgi:hypothetical protein
LTGFLFAKKYTNHNTGPRPFLAEENIFCHL